MRNKNANIPPEVRSSLENIASKPHRSSKVRIEVHIARARIKFDDMEHPATLGASTSCDQEIYDICVITTN
eukprot:1393832-Amorphochlora_amoeboformis.AAC.2